MDTSSDATKKTPLYGEHEKLGAKFTEFGGWLMPVLYSGLVDEHVAVRTHAGLFDVSHMGEVFVRGPKALEFLQHVTTNDVSVLKPGGAQYSMLLNKTGGVVDDIIVYRMTGDEFLLCINAGNTDKDWKWLQACNTTIGAKLENASSSFGQIALQGPEARAILAKFLNVPPAEVSEQAFPPFTFRQLDHPRGGALIVAMTGYTGEDGCEIFCPAATTAGVWRDLLEIGKSYGLKPAGLGARDTLRLEACYPLHGHELTDDLTPLCAGLGWVVKFNKDFIGKDVLVKEKQSGSPYRLAGLEVRDRGIIRQGAKLFAPDGAEVGWVTSGTMPPTVGKAIGLGFVRPDFAALGTDLKAEVRGKLLPVQVVQKPFYKRK